VITLAAPVILKIRRRIPACIYRQVSMPFPEEWKQVNARLRGGIS
jgi:hypothetical protein